MQNDDLDSSLEPLVRALRELPQSDSRAVKRVLARVRLDEGRPNARLRAVRRLLAQRRGWSAAAAVLVIGAGVTLFARSGVQSDRNAEVASVGDGTVLPPAERPGLDAAAEERDRAERLVAREFVIETNQASQVALVGDFNQWNPERHRLHRDGRTARWYITVRLPAGLHKYAFIVDDSVWTPDPSAVRTVDRDFGVTSSLVLVQ